MPQSAFTLTTRAAASGANLWRAPSLGGGLGFLIDTAWELARICATAPVPVVFCPPLVTFKTPHNAKDENVADGLALSVDCDTDPAAARAALEARLGPATVSVASGGEWVDPDTGEVAPKLHCHWRLSAPARTVDEHNALKLARRRAMRLINGDVTGVPLCRQPQRLGSIPRPADGKQAPGPRGLRVA